MDWSAVLLVLVVIALVLWWYVNSSRRKPQPSPRPSRRVDFADLGVTVVAPSNYDDARFQADPPGAVPPEKKELGIRVVRAVFDLVVTDRDERSVLVFDPPLTVTMRYTEADAKTAGGAERLGVFLYSPSNGKWKHLKPVIDAGAQSATFELSALLGTDDPVGFDF